MLWEEFRKQARQDLVSCKTLYKKKDYGNSAYLLQQSLEKFVKAYILRYDLFVRKPYKFRHLPVEKMWEILRCELERRQKSYKKELQTFVKNFSTMLELITYYFFKIRDPDHTDARWKCGVWKYSLGLALNTSEKTLFEQLTNNMREEFTPLLSEAHVLFSNAKKRILSSLSKKPHQQKLLKHLVEEITGLSLEIEIEQNRTSNINLDETLDKVPLWFDELEKLIKALIKMWPQKESLIQEPFMKILLLAWLFSNRDEMVMTFPHEDIGRYPDIIDINTRRIYENNASTLDSLIKRVSERCRKIDEMINL